MTTVLTREQFLATFVEPMHSLSVSDFVDTTGIGAYVDECLQALDLQVARERLEVQHVYENGDRSFIHVLIFFGRNNIYLAIVIDHTRTAIHGCFLLDLNKEYGLGSNV